MSATQQDLKFGQEPAGIYAEGVSKRYGSYEALHPTGLTIARGEQVAIMGPSGCGKTTLLNILGGIDRPSSGHVVLCGRELSYGDRDLTRLHRTTVGFVFQGYGLIPSLTAAENVEFTTLAAGVDPGTRRSRALSLLGEVGLGEYADRYPEELSGGQRQRVAVARSLAHAPAVVLADEPTGNLDRETGMQVIGLLGRACRESGAALVVVTHDAEVALRLGRVVQMKDGRIISAGDSQAPAASPDPGFSASKEARS